METKAPELDEQSKKVFVGVLGQCRDVLNSFDDNQLAEPWLTHYRKIKNDYDSALKGLGPSDQVMAALDAKRHLNCLYSILSSANNMCSMLTNSIVDMKKNAATALNSAVEAAIAERIRNGELVAKADIESRVTAGMKAGVDAEITSRIGKGDLIAKDTHTQLCSAAKELGLKEGKESAEQAAKAEKNRVETVERRKNLLVTNGIPVPLTDIEKALGGTDAEFEGRQTTAKSRMQNLMEKGLNLNADNAAWDNIWKEEAAYKTFESLAESLVSGEPFATGKSRAASAPSGPILC